MDKCPITGLPCAHKKCIHVTEITNFQATGAQSMCVNCGLSYIAKEGGKQFDATANKVFEMINLIIKNSVIEDNIILQPLQGGCPSCGHTLENILMTGKVGCGDCYNYYKKELLPLINKCQAFATKHTGKSPKHPVSLRTLEDELNIAIKKEDYEKADIIKKEIEKLK